ncbi:MAG: diaminohydroxyphosphoribosylaminopyrimidine deaminase [Cycloclasticus pugetii]|jgi:diaminohydroxyphosphoribosylaminopyrimidine deaminase/5-amino-6-(5-phosphoribosylamino)uracil reductase|uniref:bifunctional diaminohydroxyphosphoribosylaminopyrimidine deaminase/5-amino-6-(5-phosphoribosylamino)uracil reductase RibD n=1 Tax=Cycloclasticus pugetii TaxID=34068 RepID=UPI0039E68234
MTFTSDDQRYMNRALELAAQGQYSAKPNPCVGCVIVYKGEIVGEGWHKKAGEPHAEVHALQQAGASANGATAYVTLEPCSHQGRTPPCADALIKAGVLRVVIAMQDPNPLVAGKGIAKLRDAGIDVCVGLLEEQARALNKAFCHKMTTAKPYVVSKVAMSLDGKTAMASGESQWITGSAARQDVHRLRAESDIVLTGVGTILADDPQLTARDGLAGFLVQQPRIVVLDSQLKTPLSARIFHSNADSTVLTCSNNEEAKLALEQMGCHVEVIAADSKGQVDLGAVYEWLISQAVNSVMVEAGALLNGACLQAGIVDELIIYMAPSALGADARGAFSMPTVSKLSERVQLNYIGMDVLSDDIKLTYKVKREA